MACRDGTVIALAEPSSGGAVIVGRDGMPVDDGEPVAVGMCVICDIDAEELLPLPLPPLPSPIMVPLPAGAP